eukprot:1093965-Amphidinium_carterae.1
MKHVINECSIDRRRIYVSGNSMGGYGCLKLAVRWPSFFAAVAPVAAHYEEDLDELVETLTSRPMPPFWFIQATNDAICEFKPIKKLVRDLQWLSSVEVKLTAFEDTLGKTFPNSNRRAFLEELCSSMCVYAEVGSVGLWQLVVPT